MKCNCVPYLFSTYLHELTIRYVAPIFDLSHIGATISATDHNLTMSVT